jgi:ABC-type cobalamin/Fe3+-siderophores transport system ATPase subunit
MLTFEISALTFSDGSAASLKSPSLVLLIGPNSCGKTRALREIDYKVCARGNAPLAVVPDIQVSATGTHEEILDWLQRNYVVRDRDGGDVFVTMNHAFPRRRIDDSWKDTAGVRPFLCHRLTTEDRLAVVSIKESRGRNENPTEYVHVVQASDSILQELTREVQSAFDKKIVINWGGGKNVWFHAGKEPHRTAVRDRVSADYLQELEQQPHLAEEGDGLKSFVGCLLAVLCGAHKVLLIDEPEAFLHPPQVRKLGRVHAESAHRLERQIIAATHSSDLIRGALSTPRDICICRMERTGNTNSAILLDNTQIRDLLGNPILQSSNVIDGAFHQGVVVCEADADRRFYESLSARMIAKCLNPKIR